jgi:hypothetical protein
MKMLVFKSIDKNGKPFQLSLSSSSIVSIEEESTAVSAKTCILRARKGEKYRVEGDFATISEQVSPRETRWSETKNFLNTKLGALLLTAVFVTGGGALIKKAVEQYAERQKTIARERSLLVEFDSRVFQLRSVETEINEEPTPIRKSDSSLCLWWIVKGTEGVCNADKPLRPLVDVVNELTGLDVGVNPEEVQKTIGDLSSFNGADTISDENGRPRRLYKPDVLDQRLNSLRSYSKAVWNKIQ